MFRPLGRETRNNVGLEECRPPAAKTMTRTCRRGETHASAWPSDAAVIFSRLALGDLVDFHFLVITCEFAPKERRRFALLQI